MQNNFDLDLRSIQLQNERLLRELTEVHKLLESSEEKTIVSKEFYTIEDCAELKGGAALNTYKSNRFMLPGCGNPKYSVFILGRLAFPHKEVMRWLKVSDSEYLDYAKECGVSVIPEKYLRLSHKARQSAGVKTC
ncbi:hypothetical protein [Treponema sp.]|uniref:hypothetical protein n=1 Tax=Treponema sp. TaxID=166 RepID=UPI0025D4D0E0|nr:hypothetical protein [Treponema sp.]MBR4321791.1 hypothetical protein [Treponema sp.]